MEYYPLCSTSTGNSHFLGTYESGGLLIDCGWNCKRITECLACNGLSLSHIKGICITHTHSDHIAALKVLLPKLDPRVCVCGSREVLNFLGENGWFRNPSQPTRLLDPEHAIELDGFHIDAFPTMHDSDGSQGYVITTPDHKRIGFCTDLGKVTDTVCMALCGCTVVLLESNYDPYMLANSTRDPWNKERVKGEWGHLSNEDSAKFARYLVEHGTKHLILGHLSDDHNTHALALAQARAALIDYVEGVDYVISVAPKETKGERILC